MQKRILKTNRKKCGLWSILKFPNHKLSSVKHPINIWKKSQNCYLNLISFRRYRNHFWMSNVFCLVSKAQKWIFSKLMYTCFVGFNLFSLNLTSKFFLEFLHFFQFFYQTIKSRPYTTLAQKLTKIMIKIKKWQIEKRCSWNLFCAFCQVSVIFFVNYQTSKLFFFAYTVLHFFHPVLIAPEAQYQISRRPKWYKFAISEPPSIHPWSDFKET